MAAYLKVNNHMNGDDQRLGEKDECYVGKKTL